MILQATTDVGFIMVVYNLRRLIIIIGENELIKHLKEIHSFNLPKKLLLKLETYILAI